MPGKLLFYYERKIIAVKSIYVNIYVQNGVNFLIHLFKHMCFGAKKNRLIETVILITHNICFREEI